ncbi:MAG: T9SS type A sorting domain-containing protein [Ignavibacteriaceae bacterium]
MIHKNFKYFLLSIILLLSLNGNMFGQLLVDNFEYSGQLNANGWDIHSGTTNFLSTTSGLTYSGYTGSGLGNAVLVQNLGGEDVNKGFTEQNVDGTSIYYSTLVNVNDAASTKSGDYFLMIGNRVNGTTFTLFSARVFAKITSDVVNFGISNTSTATYGTTSFAKNTTYLLIVKYTISAAGFDEAKLWVIPSGIPSNEVAAGTPEVTNTITEGDEILDAVGIRQGSSTTSPQTVLDGLRIGTAWADLFPATGSATLTATPSSLSGFEYIVGAGPSTSQSYSLTGSSLSPASGNITVTGSTNFEVSLNNSTFSGNVNISYAGGALASTPVYVRLKLGLAAGTYNGELVVNSGGSTTANVTCNGAVIAGEPTNYPTSFSGVLGNPAYYYNNLSWVDAAGGVVPTGYLIKSSYVSFADIVTPVDGVAETNTLRIQNVAQGLQSAVFSGFGGSTYYYKIYPYTGSGVNIDYKTSGSVPQFSITNAPAPTLPLTETFNYTTGSNLTANGFVAHSSAGTNPIEVTASPLTYSGYLNSGLGKSVSLTGSGEDVNKAFDSVYSNSVYASFMVNVQTATTTGDYFFHLAPENSTSIFCGKVFVKDDGSGNLAFGVSKRNNTATAVYTPNNYALNTTYLIAVKYTFNNGSTVDDQVSLWVNPVLNGTEPAANVTATDTITDALSLGLFALRQGGSTSAPTLTLGGVRISTSWIPNAASTFNATVSVGNEWNLISFPGIHPNSMLADTLYRGRHLPTPVYKYTSTGYVGVSTLTAAEGYWLFHTGVRVYNWNGTVQSGVLYPKLSYAEVDTINAFAGWNIIGIYEYQINPSNIVTIPAGLITNPLFQYVPGSGYGIAATLNQGSGYWVQMNAAGKILLPNRVTAKIVNETKNYIKDTWGRIIISDSDNKAYTLYSANDNSEILLPPAPPANIFDVRFASQSLVENIASEKVIDISNAVFPIKIRTEKNSLVIKDAVTGKVIGSIEDGKELIITDQAVSKIIVSGGESIPTEFSLNQNYPNPFNPSTKISYSLAAASDVTVKIFNSLGEEVATLVNQKQEAGRYELNFNSTGLASGMYLYKIQAGAFTQTKKMILMK